MDMQKLKSVIENVYSDKIPEIADICFLLNLQEKDAVDVLFEFADGVRDKYLGDEVILRGIVEFSNYCVGTCSYCGLNRFNSELKRYRLKADQIIDGAKEISRSGIKTIVLQSGQEDDLDSYWLKEIIEEIKVKYDLAVTLSIGEKSYQDYKLWREAGADRYLLKIETSDSNLYHKLHPEMSYQNRVRCLNDLSTLGYQAGSGNIIGLKGQNVENIAKDILFFKKMRLGMLSVTPFIPNMNTVLSNELPGDVMQTLKTLAVARIVTKTPHMPATTAIGSIDKKDWRLYALKCGANVIMPNFTPKNERMLYEIYPNKICFKENPTKAIDSLFQKIKNISRNINFSRGDAVYLSKQIS